MKNIFANTAARIVTQAGALLMDAAKRDLQVKEKGSDYDFVTNADLASQSFIKKALKEAFPDHEFIGEEDGLSDSDIAKRLYGNPSSYFWVVDPLDGTQNYIKHLSGYGVSACLFHDGRVIAGATFVPVENEIFIGAEGEGAFLNGRQIHVSSCATLHSSFLTTGIPTVNMEYRSRILRHFSDIAERSLNLRIIGCATRALAMVAAGNFEGYWEIGPHPWDVGVATLLIQEAGGRITRFDGSAYHLGDPDILATNNHIHQEMVKLLHE